MTTKNFILCNNPDNQVDVYSDENQFVTTINIQKKGLVCSKVLKKKMLIGCKDGTVFEVDSKEWAVTKTHTISTCVTAIEHLNGFMEDTYVISQAIPSGYLDPRSRLEVIVSLPDIKDEFMCLESIVVQAGHINKMVQNRFNKQELILATQTGLYFVIAALEEMPESVKLDPVQAKTWTPAFTMTMLDENYHFGKMVSQVAQQDKNFVLISIWDEPFYWLIDRYSRIETKIEDPSMGYTNLYCTDLQMLDTSFYKNFPKSLRNTVAISRTLNAINLVNIKGKSVHQIKATKNSQGRTQKLLIRYNSESTDMEELVSIVFVDETQTKSNLMKTSAENEKPPLTPQKTLKKKKTSTEVNEPSAIAKMFFNPEHKQLTTEVQQISMNMKFFVGLQGFLASYQPDLDPNQ